MTILTSMFLCPEISLLFLYSYFKPLYHSNNSKISIKVSVQKCRFITNLWFTISVILVLGAVQFVLLYKVFFLIVFDATVLSTELFHYCSFARWNVSIWPCSTEIAWKSVFRKCDHKSSKSGVTMCHWVSRQLIIPLPIL